jgi:subtilisin-like proprotein convertase family protein
MPSFARATALALPLALALALAAAPAAADVLTPTLGEPITEVSHSVDVTIDRGVGVYKVRRVFANAGKRADEAGLEIDLPPGAAATGLRIRARERWYDGELLEATKAAEMYQELTGMGAHQPKDPALLQWLWADKLYLQVFPVMPGSTSTVEYTLTVPTRYAGGQIFLSYPRTGAQGGDDADPDAGARGATLATPVLTVRPAWADATTRIVVDGLRVVSDAPLALLPPAVPAWLAALSPDPSASYVASELVVPEVAATKGAFATATLALDLDHTYKSDLRIALVTPKGESIEVFGGGGAGANDVKGTFTLALPKGTIGAGTWRLLVSDHVARDAGTVAAWSLALGTGKTPYRIESVDTPVFIPDAPETANDAGLASIIVAPPEIDKLVARFGKAVASAEHAFARLEVDVAPQLAKLPKRAQVVFAIDLSHSEGEAGIAAQLAVAKAYVAHVPDAQVELVGYHRTAARVFARFVEGKDLAAAIADAEKAGAFAPRNGSALELGAKVAAETLAKRTGPRRIVITTDQLLRSAFTNDLAIVALEGAPAGTVVHVVEAQADGGDETGLARGEVTDLEPIAAAHHGIFGRMYGLPAKTDKPLVDAVLELVRPIRIDRVAIDGIEAAIESQSPASLDEGDGMRDVLALPKDKIPDKLVITGKIWGDGYRKVVKVDAGFSRATAAFAFAEDDYSALSREEQLTLAFFGRAVSPVTSYLAIEPGTRPSTIGLPGRGLSGRGAGGGAMVRLGSASAGRRPPDLMALVAGAAKACVAKHAPAAGWKVSVDVETTLTEVVDVATTTTTPIATCLVEAVWAVRLTSAFTLSRERFTLDFE